MAITSRPLRPGRAGNPAGGSLQRHHTRTAYLFLFLPLAFFLLVRFVPTVMAMRMSLFDWNILKQAQPFVGIENYQTLLADCLLYTSPSPRD